MATVVPKVIYSKYHHGDIPIWVITTDNGRRIYYERVHRPGYRPIGLSNSYTRGKTTFNVCELEVPSPGSFVMIYTEKRGYKAPMTWYEVDPNYKGPVRVYQDTEVNIVVEDEDELIEDYEY